MRALHTVVAGMAGAAALEALAPIERRLSGRVPAFASSQVAARLLPGLPAGPAGIALRLGWSTLWAALLGARADARERPVVLFPVSASPAARPVVRCRPPGALLWKVAVIAALLAGERLLLPATGATPPWRAWPRRERALWLLHVAAWAAAVSWASSALLRVPRAVVGEVDQRDPGRACGRRDGAAVAAPW